MSRDRIYAEGEPPDGPFEFSEDVARVFPDMLRRSIPGYAATIQAIRTLAGEHVMPNTQLYDLGCSLGAATRAMRKGISVPGCRVIAVDNAPAMVRRCRAVLAEDDDQTPVDVHAGDIRELTITNASMVVMNYTLQFLAPDDRPSMIERIADGMVDGGVFVLSEKVIHPDPDIEAALKALHVDFKRRHAYSELEISRKRAALENVLIPDTVETHAKRLRAAGFRHVGTWLTYFNFVSMIAFR